MVDAQVHCVIDNGTGYMKAGFSGEEAPKAVFPTLIGIPKKNALLGSETKNRLIGQEALEKLAIQDIHYPIKKGEIVDWSDMEKIWHHTFYNELRIAPEDHVVLLTDPPITNEKSREKMTEMMFENFSVPGLFICSQSVLAIYSTGKTSGMVLESGESKTYFVPIFEGYEFSNSISQFNLGGSDLTAYLIRMLIEKRYTIDTKAKELIVNDIKEKLCYVSPDYENEMKETNQGVKKETKYKMPDGEEINLEYERFRCPEIMFKPNLIGKEEGGVHEVCYNTLMNSDIEIRKELFSNIILSGGNTMFAGFRDRLNKELQKLTPSSTSGKIKVIAFPERKYASWIGGSILSSLSNFQYLWITKGEYDDVGAQIVHKKCF